MADYGKGVNLASDVIRPGLRVSTAKFPAREGDPCDGPLIEAWIFDERPGQSRQIFHRTEASEIRAHGHIVRNLRRQEAPDA